MSEKKYDDMIEEYKQTIERKRKQNKKQNNNNNKKNVTERKKIEFKTKIYSHANYYIQVIPNAKQYRYSLLKDNTMIDEHVTDKRPADCNKDTKFILTFAKNLTGVVMTESEGYIIETSDIAKRIMQQLRILQEEIDDYEEHKDEILNEEAKEREKKRLEEVTPNYEKLVNLLNSSDASIIDYIQICITYLLNGENKNVLVGLLCHLSTYFKREPLWFMAVGKTTEGKSKIEKASIDLLPKNAYMNGDITEAGLSRKTLKEGNHFIDGKIMRMGDLGGKRDFENHKNTLDAYKKLSTEGVIEVERTSDTPDEELGERDTIKSELKGYCSVSFTTVHTEDIDQQYVNRGRLVEPESTNDHVEQYNLLYQGKYMKEVEKIKDYYIKELLHDYIEYIHLKCRDMQTLNPYLKCLYNWLREDEYFKRSIKQYSKLVETVTILNYPNREIVSNTEGDEYIVSTPADNELISTLFIPSFGLSPVAIRLFNKIIDWFFKEALWINNDLLNGKKDAETVKGYLESADKELEKYEIGEHNTHDFISIFTVAEITRRTKQIKSLKGVDVSGIIGNLIQKGYIITTDVKVQGTSRNVYKLNYYKHIENQGIVFDDECISSYMNDVVEMTHGTIPYTHPPRFAQKKNKNIFENLRECSVDGLTPAKWFL